MIARARAAGAAAVVAIGESLGRPRARADVAAAHPGFVYFTAGVHPHDAASFDAIHDPGAIRAEVERGAVAIGECGLDYHYDNSPRQLQRRAFAAQLALAGETGARWSSTRATPRTTPRRWCARPAAPASAAYCTASPGSHALAHAALDSGWYISFSGIVTFKKWTDDALLRLVPDDRLLVESDSPYLAPVPDRGKRNEPAWVARTVGRVAAARGAPSDTVGELTVSNAARFFGFNAT